MRAEKRARLLSDRHCGVFAQQCARTVHTRCPQTALTENPHVHADPDSAPPRGQAPTPAAAVGGEEANRNHVARYLHTRWQYARCRFLSARGRLGGTDRMLCMSAPSARTLTRRPWAAYTAVAITAAACVAALLFRGPLLARYWAFRLMHAETPALRSSCLGVLCRLAPSAHGAVKMLLNSRNPADRRDAARVLEWMPGAWARERLLELLRDPDDEVREAAEGALGFRHEDAVIPTLKSYYQCADTNVALSACAVLSYLRTPEAIRVLTGLAGEEADVDRRAGLVDALDSVGTPACVPALLRLLDDHRLCDQPSLVERHLLRVWQRIRTDPRVPALATLATSAPRRQTIAERAAAALRRITGLELPFTSDAPEPQRREYHRVWEEWYLTQGEGE